MNYQKIYDSLIEKSKKKIIVHDGFYERHYIIPRCMGGTNRPENIATLTQKEHYIAYKLLVKIYPNNRALKESAIQTTPNRKTNKNTKHPKQLTV